MDANDDGHVDPTHRESFVDPIHVGTDQQQYNGGAEKPQLPRLSMQQQFNGGAEKPRPRPLSIETLPELDQIPTLMSPRANTMNPFRRVHKPLEYDDYFVCLTIFTPTSFT